MTDIAFQNTFFLISSSCWGTKSLECATRDDDDDIMVAKSLNVGCLTLFVSPFIGPAYKIRQLLPEYGFGLPHSIIPLGPHSFDGTENGAQYATGRGKNLNVDKFIIPHVNNPEQKKKRKKERKGNKFELQRTTFSCFEVYPTHLRELFCMDNQIFSVFFAFCGACCYSNWKVDIFSDFCLQQEPLPTLSPNPSMQHILGTFYLKKTQFNSSRSLPQLQVSTTFEVQGEECTLLSFVT
jgi:hypothetical protein